MKKILCVADDEMTLRVQTFMLKARGYAAQSAQSGQVLLEAVDAGGIDLVLISYGMTCADGGDLVTAIKQRAPDLPVVVLAPDGTRYANAGEGDFFFAKGGPNACAPLDVLRGITALLRPRMRQVG